MPTMDRQPCASFESLLAAMSAIVTGRCHRLMLCIEGSRDEALSLLQQQQLPLQAFCSDYPPVAFSAKEPENALLALLSTFPASKHSAVADCMATPRTARHWLGRENGLLIYDAHDGFYPDAFAALTGTVTGGGLVVLLLPDGQQRETAATFRRSDLASYPYVPEAVNLYAEQRLCRLLQADAACAFWHLASQSGSFAMPDVSSVESEQHRIPETGEPIDTGVQSRCLGDQQIAVSAISKVVRGHRNRPLVLQADRGRGKSAALGLAVTSLVKTGYQGRVLVTAPARKACDSVFDFLDDMAKAQVVFIAPDALLEQLENGEKPGDLLLVDEAAAIPLALLQRFLQAFSRVVFASTIHGYEGSGRGFALGFRKLLDELAPQWRLLELQQPLRWAADCPLEKQVFAALLLNAELPVLPSILPATARDSKLITTREVGQLLLATDENLLSAVFALLVNAHYRSSPDDLWVLLNAPGIRVFISEVDGLPVAAALLAEEGAFDKVLAEQIWQAERRLHHHLLPQVLAQQLHKREALEKSYYRIMRIAVHPEWQGKGLGSALLQFIEQQLRSESPARHFLGSSFSASAEVAAFWLKNGYQPLRCGLTQQVSSAAPALLVLKTLQEDASSLLDSLQQEFTRSFCESLPLEFAALDAELVIQLITNPGFSAALQRQAGGKSENLLQPRDHELLQFYVAGKRPLYNAYAAGGRWVLVKSGATCWQKLSIQQQVLLVQAFLQRLPEKRLVAIHKLQGKKALGVLLAEALSLLL